MKSSFAAAIAPLALIVLEGCSGKPAMNQNAASQSAQPATPVAAPASATVDAYPVPESPTPTIADTDRPNSIDEFRAEVFRRFQDNNYAPFIELAYWGSSTDEQKKEYLTRVRSGFMQFSNRGPAVVKSANDIEIHAVGDSYTAEGAAMQLGDGKAVPLVPAPTHVLRVYWHAVLPPQQQPPSEDEGVVEDLSTSRNFPVGVHEGKYYFCTIKREE